MKTTLTIRLMGLALFLAFNTAGILAQSNVITASDSIPKKDTIYVAAAPAAAPEKEKKEGFNSHTRFGVRVGGIISKQDFESSSITEDPESKFGADLAVLASIPIGGGFFMLQPELHWMQKGFKIQDAITGDDFTSTLNYIELPLLARINFGGSLKIFAFAGPSVGYLISGSYENANGGQDAQDILDELEYSGYLGLGVGLGTLELDVRYIAGLSDLADSPTISDVKNSSFGAGLSLKF
jgi:hypothetical protein